MRKAHRIQLPTDLRDAVVVADNTGTQLVTIDRGGPTALRLRKELAEHRMKLIDNLSPTERAVANGLGNPVDLALACAEGCRSQADAEEWVRHNYGPSAVERRC